MKKILLTLVGLSALMGIHAQVVEIYKNGQLTQTYNNTSTSQYEVVFKPSGGQGEINGHAYVEIGGRKWATMNVGATTVAGSPKTAYGDYYTWGELETYYNSLTETGIIFKGNAQYTHVKGQKISYNWNNYCGVTDNKFKEWDDNPAMLHVVLAEYYDVVRFKWGDQWRIPTFNDFQSLVKHCGNSATLIDAPESITKGGVYWVTAGATIDGTTYGVAGALFVTTEDLAKRLFFPGGGNLQSIERDGVGTLCTYWSSTWLSSNQAYAMALSVSTKEHTVNLIHNSVVRCYGLSIRPIAD